MNTTVVAQSAIGALAALIGGLGGASIATRHQRSNERNRQRERAAEVLGSVGPLLTELHPTRLLIRTYTVENLGLGQQDPIDEALAKLAKLDKRVPIVREQLSALAGWWSTPRGSDMAEQLQTAIYEVRHFDELMLQHHFAKSDKTASRARAHKAWENADSLANQLRAEIRGKAAPPPKKLLLPAHPESWTARGVRSTRQGQAR